MTFAKFFPILPTIRDTWKRSPGFRVLLTCALVYFVFRLGMQAFLLFDPVSQQIAADLQTYINGARDFQQRQGLYPPLPLQDMNFYQYAPFYALAFAPFLVLTPLQTAVVHTLIHLAAYVLLYLWWGRIFTRLGLEQAGRWLALSLPAWLVFAAFWADLAYLNIYLIVALQATLLIEAVLEERLGWAALWLVLILQVKPHWAFAALVPLLMGRRVFFARLLGLAVAGYAAAFLVTLAAGGEYAWQQYVAYFRFMPAISANFPWRGPADGFLGYDHSLKQVVVFLLGVHPSNLLLADLIKVVLLLPLALIVLANAARPVKKTAREDPQRFLDLCFAIYAGAFIWLDMVWELSLAPAVFAYLAATLRPSGTGGRISLALVWGMFLLYALVDVWQVASYLIFGPRVILEDAYIATDPTIYAPIILILAMVFYQALAGRLWAATFQSGRIVKWKLNNSST